VACPDDNELLAYVERDGAQRFEGIAAHVRDCADCRRLLVLLTEPEVTAPGTDADGKQPAALGRYRIDRVLGQGGMGVVYGGFDPELQRPTAVKTLPRAGVVQTARLRREAAAMAKLSHPNVVQVFDVGEDDGRLYVAMELIDGESLAERLERSPALAWPEVAAMLDAVAEGVAAAHAAGIVHRDLKPGNVLLCRDGRIAVSDFGLALQIRAQTSTDGEPVVGGAEDESFPASETLRAAGTPAYMAPEQHHGDPSDERTDVYALCAMAYHIAYGVRPFARRDGRSLLAAKLARQLEPPRQDAPAWVMAVLERGLAPEPEERWSSIEALRTALRHGGERRRGWRAGVGAAALGLVGAAWIFGSTAATDEGCPRAEEIAAQWADAQPALEALYESNGRAQVSTSFHRVHTDLSRYQASLAAQYRGLCAAATEPTARSQATAACLESAHGAFVAVVEQIDAPPADLVHRLEPAVRLLPKPERCRRPQTPAVSHDPGRFDAIVDLRRQLARAAVLIDLGAYPSAKSSLHALADRATELGEPWLTRTAALLDLRLAYSAGDYRAVATAGSELHALATESDDDETASEAALLAARSLAVTGSPPEAKVWLRHAAAALARVEDPRKRSDFEAAALVVYATAGELDRAIQYGEAAVAIGNDDVGKSEWARGMMLNDLANAYLLDGQYATARDRAERGLKLIEAEFGSDHPQVAALLVTLGSIMVRLGHTDEAAAHLRNADGILERAGAQPQRRFAIRVNLGSIEIARGKFADAREVLLAVDEELVAAGKDEDPLRLVVLNNLAAAEVELNLLPEARGRFEALLRIHERREDGPTTKSAQANSQLGQVDLAAGELESAKARFERALLQYEAAAGADSIGAAHPRAGLGRVALAQGKPGLAVKHLEQATALLGADAQTPQAQDIRGYLKAAQAAADPH